MNDFDRLEEIERKTGKVVEMTKDIEGRLDDIILEYITRELPRVSPYGLNSWRHVWGS